jgi:cell fate regulator YaaT (PSP1 superfamily)
MELPNGQKQFEIVEVRFKNSRKEFYRNNSGQDLVQGDIVAVEGSPGHDIGAVSLSGELVKMQMKKLNIPMDSAEIKSLYRKAKTADIDKWQATIGREVDTMYKARVIASGIGLDMKLSDVEFQGDGSKATFFYTAPDRVDFRELIKKLAEEFRVRIEMRQIGQRQEAARLGGVGSCGRELCCSTWLRDFRTVNTSAARYQQLALNPLKLAGQCGKLKCCLNYELDSYLDAIKDFPSHEKPLETQKGLAVHMKTDIFRRTMWYAYRDNMGLFIPMSVDRVKEVYALNAEGVKPEDLVVEVAKLPAKKEPDFENVVGQDSLTRFDRTKKKPNNKRKGGNKNRPQGPNPNANLNTGGAEKGPEGGGENKPENKNQGGGNNQNRGPRDNNNRPPRDNSNRPPRDNNNRPPRNNNNRNRPPRPPQNPPPPQQ